MVLLNTEVRSWLKHAITGKFEIYGARSGKLVLTDSFYSFYFSMIYTCTIALFWEFLLSRSPPFGATLRPVCLLHEVLHKYYAKLRVPPFAKSPPFGATLRPVCLLHEVLHKYYAKLRVPPFVKSPLWCNVETSVSVAWGSPQVLCQIEYCLPTTLYPLNLAELSPRRTIGEC